MDRHSSIDTYQTLVSAFTELLTVSVHTILAERDVYPRASFLKSRKWGLAVYQSRHPGVIKWIEDAVEAVEKEILKGTVRQTSLIILSPASVPLERFVFSTASFPALPTSSTLTPFATSTTAATATGNSGNNADAPEAGDEDPAGTQIPGMSMIDLATQFRGLLSRLCSVGARLAPLPPACTFTIGIELRDRPEGEPPIGWPQPFIPSDPKAGLPNPQSSRVTPVRNVGIGVFEMETWVEETKEKMETASQLAQAAAAVERSPSPPDDRITDPLLEAMEGKTFM